jgi:hypothetical protein
MADDDGGGARRLVDVDTFVRAETDRYFAGIAGPESLASLHHARTPASIDDQTVVRMNRDTLYSHAVVDLAASDVTVRLPETHGRFMSLQVIDEDHYTPGVFYGTHPQRFSRRSIGTRYAALLIRTLVDPENREDVKAVHVLQDAIELHVEDPGTFEVPRWDEQTLTTVRDTLRRVAPTVVRVPAVGFGTKAEVDPIRHLVGTAIGWGANPEYAAVYVGAFPGRNDGTTPYVLRVRDVPVDGFWSISVYNEHGFFEKNSSNRYSLNNLTAEAEEDGSVVVRFGGDPGAGNRLPIMPGWNYTVRMYRPRPEVLDGSWTFPEAEIAR